MKTVYSIISGLAFCALLAACGDSTTTTTTETDTTTLNGSPLSPTASDNTGAGIEGGTVSGAANDPAGRGTSSTPSPATTENVPASQDRTSGRNNPESERNRKLQPTDSISNRSGLAPVK